MSYFYLILLNAYDFQARPLMFPKGSLGGVYMIPLGLHSESIFSRTTVPTVYLTHSEVSTNVAMDSIIYNICTAETKGVRAKDYSGQ